MPENEVTKERVGSVYHAGDKPPIYDAYSVIALDGGYLTTAIGYYSGVDEDKKSVWIFAGKSKKDTIEVIAWTEIEDFAELDRWCNNVHCDEVIRKQRKTRNSTAIVTYGGATYDPFYVDNFYMFADDNGGYAPEVELYFNQYCSKSLCCIILGESTINALCQYFKENKDKLYCNCHNYYHLYKSREDCDYTVCARYEKEGIVNIEIIDDNGLIIDATSGVTNIRLRLGYSDLNYMYEIFKKEHLLYDNQDD